MIRARAHAESFELNQPIHCTTSAGEILIGRFQRYLNHSRTRARVRLVGLRQLNGRTRDAVKTVNVRRLSQVPGKRLAELTQRHEQAVVAYPILKCLLTASGVSSPHKLKGPRTPRWCFDGLSRTERRRIVATVDAGEPLLPVLTQVFKVSPWVLRHLGRHQRVYCSTFHADLVSALQTLNWIKPEWAPKTARSLERWKDGLDSLRCLIDVERRSAHALGPLMSNLQACDDLARFVHFLITLAAWIDAGTPSPIPLGSRLGVTTVNECLDMSRRWNRAVLLQVGRSVPEYGEWCLQRGPLPQVKWRLLFGNPVRRGDHRFECLGSQEAVSFTAQTLQNCLYQYVAPALAGTLHLVKVSIEEQIVAALDIRREADGTLRLQQAAGPKNAALDEPTLSVIESFISELNLNPEMASARNPSVTPEELLAGRASTRVFAALAYRAAEQVRANHFQCLAEVYGEEGFAQYRGCLELRPSQDSFYIEALRAARWVQSRQCSVSGICASMSQRALSRKTASRQSLKAA